MLRNRCRIRVVGRRARTILEGGTVGVSNKLKHLEFIQAAINRMAGNLFMLKGWSVTLIAALFALAAKD